MKRIILLYGIIILFGLMLISCQAESDTNDITFTDEHLEKAVRKAIDQHDGVIKQSDIEKITELDAENLSIQSLDGIETLQSLKTLNIKGNKITDFSLLKELKNIKTINVIGNPLDDTKQLATLSKLSNQGIRVIRMEEAEGPGGFLWKVTNGKTTVYLQGTMHAGVQDMYPLHEKIEEAYAEADVVVPEVDITNLDFNEMQELMFLLGTYEDGTTIKDHLPKDVYDQLLTVLEELELTPDLIAQYKPWFIASTIESMLVQKYRFEHGVDEYFLNRAAEDGKKIVALETAEQQFRIFADRSDAFQIDYLTSSLESINGYEDSMRELMSLYIMEMSIIYSSI
ncbi:TraB/GumN family protein [Virgibacillus soli]|uniref:TraB/GumN family protein n=1 Tax=Paracerasibacillus soli TaxID=480284 RepID=A0ABU5CQK1_9BACI|nr:TraB/GumN family protein [Virgibacillus soli]MDY0407740.1 TraB/GumN family protein [Virgibacillus soli]